MMRPFVHPTRARILVCALTLLSMAAATAAEHRAQTGKASVYHRSLAGRPMADGTPLELDALLAASKTLPLGTKARVTDLRNGKSVIVEIRDRGPYVKGRIIDLSPRAARELRIGKEGVVPVAVVPLSAPPGTPR